ncbi:MAG TPA: hypothetical protein VE715_20490 [Blastocatellia bacterium]|nr:hypothetical protein [Blastocatellia bacterium]
MAKQQAKKQPARKTGVDKQIYTLDVFIISGPLTRSFVKENKVISRTIQIRGDQTLEDLHNAIFYAFDREDEHMYEFQVGGEGPIDPKARRYTLHLYAEDPARLWIKRPHDAGGAMAMAYNSPLQRTGGTARNSHVMRTVDGVVIFPPSLGV